MVSPLRSMTKWNKKIEDEITLLIKDWLKQKKKTQKDLKQVLNASSERMPVLIETLKLEYLAGGLPQLVGVLCTAEQCWEENEEENKSSLNETDIPAPLGQLDLLLEEIKEDCNT